MCWPLISDIFLSLVIRSHDFSNRNQNCDDEFPCAASMPFQSLRIKVDHLRLQLGKVFQSMFYHLNRLQMTPNNEQDFQHVHSQHVKRLRTIYFRGKYFFRGSFGKFFFPLDYPRRAWASEIHSSFSIWKIIFHSFTSARNSTAITNVCWW